MAQKPQQHTDDEIRAATIGEPQQLFGPVALAEYDPDWPERFAREAAVIKEALGPAALQIEHVGSTSVPGLAAKPIIDVLLVVVHAADEPSYVPVLEARGYVLRIREPHWFEHRMLKGGGTARDVNLHVFSSGCPEIDRLVGFRDRLRANDADRDLYLRTKRELASREWRFVQNYADAKGAVIEEIIARAPGA